MSRGGVTSVGRHGDDDKGTKLVCVGEALIDFKGTGELAFQGHPGGSPYNVAIAAARLGTPTSFLSQISTDFFGERLLSHLRQSKVDASLLARSPRPTTLAFVEERGGDAEFQFFAERAADVLFDPRPRPRLPQPVRWLQFGSISLLQEPAATAITEIVAGFEGSVFFDPNVRPALISDRAAYLERLDQWASLSDVIKISVQDLSWLGYSAGEAAGRWLSAGARALVVTDGPRGARVHHAGGREASVPGVSVTVADTVGAGDSFSGALLSRFCLAGLGYSKGSSEPDAGAWHEALAFAVRAAAITCSRDGADPPWAHEIDQRQREEESS